MEAATPQITAESRLMTALDEITDDAPYIPGLRKLLGRLAKALIEYHESKAA